jgi:hypothetical protein
MSSRVDNGNEEKNFVEFRRKVRAAEVLSAAREHWLKSLHYSVGKSVRDIANQVIKAAKDGQLPPAGYLFEAVGLYPATEQAAVPPVKDTLAHTLLTRLGLPLDPVVCDEDEGFVTEVLRNDAADKGTDKTVPSVAEEDEKGECEQQTRMTLVKKEHEASNGLRDGEDAVE